ncbi:MAG: hypothetical protein E7337_09380 [Clostridiales bacterium]|nr:hypothetical protein [Clostridiales bacterium]
MFNTDRVFHKNRLLRAVFAACLLLACLAMPALAAEYPESEHPYADDSDITWEYVHDSEAYALKVTFSEESKFESGCDYLVITEEDGTQAQYTGTSLAGSEIWLLGDSFTLRLVSDFSYNYYGFAITDIAAVSQAEYDDYFNTPKFTINAYGTITDYTGQLKNLEVPAIIDGVAVTGIGASAFSKNSRLESVVLPAGVKKIDSSAFNRCKALKSIVVGDGLTTIGANAFYLCLSLESVTLPDSLTTIGAGAFMGCKELAAIRLPDGVTSIGKKAFTGNTILEFGTSDVILNHAKAAGIQYSCNSDRFVWSGADTVDEKVAWIVDAFIEPGMTEHEKALTLHNWVCSTVEYDYDYLDTDIPASEHGVGGEAALLDGFAVCQGFAESYQWLLQEAGMTALVTIGGNHAWNIVKIDGDWYQIDPTWDENINTFDYFCLTDRAMRFDHTQANRRNITCNSWEYNYEYRSGQYDTIIERIVEEVNANIAAGTFSGTVKLYDIDYSGFWTRPDAYTVASIVGSKTDWGVSGRVEFTPDKDNYAMDFVFYPDEILVTGIAIEGLDADDTPYGHYMYPGCTAQIVAETIPAGGRITYASSNESVVTVTEDGLVTAIAEGSAALTITCQDVCREFMLHVYPESRFFFYLTTDDANDIEVGQQCDFDLYGMYNLFLHDNSITWSSSDPSIAAVDENGLVTGVGYGRAVITATLSNGRSESAVVIVRKPVTAVVFDQPVIDAYAGDHLIIPLHLEGCDQEAYLEYFRYIYGSSSDSAVVKYGGYYYPTWDEEKGYYVYEVSADCLTLGEATLTIEASDGSETTGTCLIRVHEPVAEVTFDATAVTMIMGEANTLQLTAAIAPADAWNKAIVWSSSDETVATVDENGLVTALKTGHAVITAAAHNGLYAECTVSVCRPANSITVDERADMLANAYLQLTAVTDPEDAAASLFWTSSDPTVATVNAYGTVSSHALGSAVITVSDCMGLSASCTVYVHPTVNDIVVEGLEDKYETFYMYPGYSVKINADTVPAGVPIDFSGNADDVLTVAEDGTVTAVGAGYANVIMTTFNYTDYLYICVMPPENFSLYYYINGDYVLNTSETEQGYGRNSYELFLSENALTWSSSDENVLTVDENGLITAVGGGTADIILTNPAGNRYSRSFTVIQPATSVEMDQAECTLVLGETPKAKLTAVVLPESATDKSLTWTSSDATIAKVDQSGNVTALKPGSATITAAAHNSLSASCTVTVIRPVTKVTLDKTAFRMVMGETEQLALTPTILPADASDKTLTWSSSDETVAKVDENGNVTALKPGSAIITAASHNGKTASCEITVIRWAAELELNHAALTLPMKGMGSVRSLDYSFGPEDATLGNAAWKSSNSKVVKVSGGKLTPVGAGTATVTLTAENGLSASCTVTVRKALKTLSLPAALTEIQAEAFENAALECVVIPEKATAIGERAFKDCDTLMAVRIPESVKTIGNGAFDGCPGLIVYCAEGSYAHSWAAQNGIEFITE